MKKHFFTIILLSTFYAQACTQNNQDMKYNKLTPEEERIIKFKGTEAPFSGQYYNFDKKGTYLCKQCNTPLYHSTNKFDAGCGWPSFDEEIKGAVKQQPDADGSRIEILCTTCGAHLGHIFKGEKFTPKDTRHCVNSLSLNFTENDTNKNSKAETAYFAGGCFWGVEHYMQKAEGVLSTSVGYMGGKTENPSYEDVCSHTSGHAEVVEVIFDGNKTNFETVAKLFFEIHDPTQLNRQGPDIGDQYRSEIFYTNSEQKKIAEKLVQILKNKGLNVQTRLTNAPKYYEAEKYHQDYYSKKGSLPYCHAYIKRF